MEQLFRALPSVLKQLGPNRRSDEAIVFAAWGRCAGEVLRARTHPLEFFENRLIIAVEDQMWRRHLEELSPQMLVKLNASLGDGTVRFIEFRVAAAEIKAAGKMRPRSETIEAAPDVSPSITSAAEAISDEGLRRRFLEAASTILNKKA